MGTRSPTGLLLDGPRGRPLPAELRTIADLRQDQRIEDPQHCPTALLGRGQTGRGAVAATLMMAPIDNRVAHRRCRGSQIIEELNAIALQLNTHPRKTLGFMTPAAKLADAVAVTG